MATLEQAINSVRNHYQMTLLPFQQQAANQNQKLFEALRIHGTLVNQLLTTFQTQEATKKANLDIIVKMADEADEIGENDLADVLDEFSSLFRSSNVKEQLVKIANELDNSGNHDLASRMDEIIERSNQNVEIVNNLIDMADSLDRNEQYEIATAVDNIAFMIKLGSDIEEPVEPGYKRYLSSRYCPDHRGVQAVRISEGTYQCPLDGKVYNYEIGYKNYKGQIVPGGSIAGQTPDTADYGIPMRFYDSRQTVLRPLH